MLTSQEVWHSMTLDTTTKVSNKCSQMLGEFATGASLQLVNAACRCSGGEEEAGALEGGKGGGP